MSETGGQSGSGVIEMMRERGAVGDWGGGGEATESYLASNKDILPLHCSSCLAQATDRAGAFLRLLFSLYYWMISVHVPTDGPRGSDWTVPSSPSER